MNKISLLLFTILFGIIADIQAANISGKVTDKLSGEAISNALVESAKTGKHAHTDTLGFFSIEAEPGDLITISAVDFVTLEIAVPENISGTWTIQLESTAVQIGVATIVHHRLKEKLRESPVTVESLTSQAIKETPASDFYEGLGHLRGVDVTAASMAFRVVNTRGFNSSSPVRSLQLIDGVDNQAPGLNFSLGNFLGSSELDVHTTEIVVGASSAYYGPNAFNGVINMTTKSPWQYKGLSAQIKIGERELGQVMVRYANTYKNKKGRECFAWKANIFYLRAYDWVADNQDPVSNSRDKATNPGGYNAVNRYGDESGSEPDPERQRDLSSPGLGNYYRDGYWEKDLVNYNTRNLKTNLLLAYKINDKNEIQIQSNFGTGTTVYQGDNRYSLNDILFFQHRAEWIGKKGFLRFYATHEDAGKTYDAVLTALQMQEMAKPAYDDYRGVWLEDYSRYWDSKYKNKVRALPGFPTWNPVNAQQWEQWKKEYDACMQANQPTLSQWHQETRKVANSAGKYPAFPPYTFPTYNRFEPGTYRFDSLKNEIISRRSFSEKGEAVGSRFFDKSAMFHFTGERRFSIKQWKLVTGFSSRMYRPYSLGTLFLDASARITNIEAGVYAGVEKRFYDNKVKVNITSRLDKNQNFDFLFSPALSFIYSKTKKNTYRISFSSALRNPTLQDQYLHYNVGPAILLGNLNGISGVYELDNFNLYRDTRVYDTLQPIDVAKIQPERVKTLEAGYKGILMRGRLTVDAGYYISFYENFIGYKLVVDADIDTINNYPLSTQVYRIATNSKDLVSTQGLSAGLNYFLNKYLILSGNWSWNKLDRKGSNDPLIPAFNTPENKFNLGILGTSLPHSVKMFKRNMDLESFGFNVNFKWVQGYRFEGSPQFTGDVPAYWMLDAQISKQIPKWKSILKIGASNLTDNKIYQIYGGPAIGRMAYISFTYEP